jgi:hypothetical protein
MRPLLRGAADLRFGCDRTTQKYFEQTIMVSKVRKQTNSTIAIPRCALT